jgi:dTDP-4-dehydrorhamnose reductase
MKILLLGKNGQLGWELHRSLISFSDLVACGRRDLDLSRRDLLREGIRKLEPDLIINAAAYTDVDGAERETEIAYEVNAAAPEVLADEAQRLGAFLIHFSTDYVFDGTSGRAHQETDPPNPINTYGRTKLQGELAIQRASHHFIIVRTSWVYSLRRPCFLTRILERARSQDVLRIVDDQVGSPTWCRSLAEAVARLVVMTNALGMEWLEEHQGIYHLAGAGSASRFEWAESILEVDPEAESQVTQELQRAKSHEFPSAARRPGFSALDCGLFERTFGFQLPGWRTSLDLALTALS